MSIHWNSITSTEDIQSIKNQSAETPCVIFKHSTRCNISSVAKFRLESDWAFDERVKPFYLDLLNYRPVSNFIAEDFQIHHESPQVLLIVNGECIYDASHLDIAVSELSEALQGAGLLQ